MDKYVRFIIFLPCYSMLEKLFSCFSAVCGCLCLVREGGGGHRKSEERKFLLEQQEEQKQAAGRERRGGRQEARAPKKKGKALSSFVSSVAARTKKGRKVTKRPKRTSG